MKEYFRSNPIRGVALTRRSQCGQCSVTTALNCSPLRLRSSTRHWRTGTARARICAFAIPKLPPNCVGRGRGRFLFNFKYVIWLISISQGSAMGLTGFTGLLQAHDNLVHVKFPIRVCRRMMKIGALVGAGHSLICGSHMRRDSKGCEGWRN